MIRVGERLREIGDARFEPLVGFARKLSDEHLELARDELQVGEDVGEVVVQLDQLGDRRVEAQRLHVVAHTRDGAVQEPLSLDVGRAVEQGHLARLLVDDVAPQALEEPVHADHIARLPRT